MVTLLYLWNQGGFMSVKGKSLIKLIKRTDIILVKYIDCQIYRILVVVSVAKE